jgi:HAD superfamily hydrolase (TIGR01509 family)
MARTAPKPGPDAPAPAHAVIFDMDGVLTDSEPLICAAAIAMFREYGVNAQPDDFRPFVGTGEERYIGGVAERHGVVLDLQAAKRRTYEIYLKNLPGHLRAFPGAVAFVRQCRKAGLRTAVASSADWIKVAANLNAIGLPPAEWDVIVTAEDVEHKKPAPDIFLAAARKLNLTPSACVVIEDAINGIDAAHAAGMRCIAVAQSFPAHRLSHADRVKPAIADLTLAEVISQGR